MTLKEKLERLVESKTITTQNTIFYHHISVKEILAILENKK